MPQPLTYDPDEWEPIVQPKSSNAILYEPSDWEPYDTIAAPEPPKEKESSNPIYNYAKGFYTGVTSTLPEMIGQSMQAFHIAPETGKSLAEWAREGEDLTREKGMFEQAGEMTPASVGPTAALMTAGRAISMIPHPYAKLVGLGVTGLGAVLPALMFGASQYQQTKETAEKRGVDPGSAPLITGTIETAGETLGNMALMRLLGPGAPFAKAGVKNLKGVVLPTLGRYVSELAFKTMPVEIGTEMLQNWGEAEIEKAQGIRPEANPLKEAIDVIGPTAIMTVVGGGGGRILQKHIANNYLKCLSNPEEDPKVRKTVADSVTQLIKTEQKDPELAQKWQEYSDQQIQNGEPIDRNMVLTELTDTEASSVTEQSKRQEFVNQIKDRLEIGDVTIDDINNLKSQSDDMVLKSSLDKIVKDYQDITAPEGEDLGQDPLIALENFKAEIEGMDVETVLDLKNKFVKRYPHLEDQANEAIVNAQPKPKEPEAVEPPKVKFMVTQQDRTELKNWGYTDEQIDKMKPDEVQEILQGEKPKTEPEPKPIEAPAKEEKAPETAKGKAVEGEKAVPEKVEAPVEKGKEPWEITWNELTKTDDSFKIFAQNYIDVGKNPRLKTELKSWIDNNKPLAEFPKGLEVSTRAHKQIVVQALSEGKPVPESVLKDYPELKKETGLRKVETAEIKKETDVSKVPENKWQRATLENKWKEPVWEDRPRPSDKDILDARKIVQSEKKDRDKLIKETGFPQGYPYGLIEKISDTSTTKELKPTPTPEKTEVAPEGAAVKPEPIGKAWINNQQRPIMAAREITRGKNKGKVEVTMTAGRNKQGKIIPGRKVKIPKDSVIEWPGDVEVEKKVKLKAPKKSTKGANIRTLRGWINYIGKINPLNYKGEVKGMPLAAQYLFKKSGVPIDDAVRQLTDDGWLDKGTTVADFLETLRTDKAILSRDRLDRDIGEKEEHELTEQEKQLKKDMAYQPEEPPKGEYITIRAEDLPEGKKVTLLENKTSRGWDIYEVQEKDPFSITLVDGETIELKPFDKVQVLKEDVGEEIKEKQTETIDPSGAYVDWNQVKTTEKEGMKGTYYGVYNKDGSFKSWKSKTEIDRIKKAEGKDILTLGQDNYGKVKPKGEKGEQQGLGLVIEEKEQPGLFKKPETKKAQYQIGKSDKQAPESPMDGKEDRIKFIKQYQYGGASSDVYFHGSREGDLNLKKGQSRFGGGLFLANDVIYAQDYAKNESLEYVYPFSIKPKNPFNIGNKKQIKALARQLIKWYPSRYRYKGIVEDLSVEDLQTNSLYDTVEVQEALEEMGYDVVFNGTKTEALVLELEDESVLIPLPKPSSPPGKGGQKYALGKSIPLIGNETLPDKEKYDKEGLEGGKEDALYSPKKRNKTEHRSKESKRQVFSGILRKDGFNGTGTIRLLPKITKERKAVDRIAKSFGATVEFFDAKDPKIKRINGVVFNELPNTIFVNKNSTNPLIATMGHELTHTIQHQHPDVYEFLIDSMRDNTVNFKGYIDSLNVDYGTFQADREITEEFALKEFVGDFVGQQITEKSFYEKLYEKNPSLAKRLMNIVNSIIKYFKGKVDKSTEKYIKDLDHAQEVVAEVLAEVHKRESGKVGESMRAQYQISRTAQRWYSQMTNVLSQKLPGKGTPESYASTIEGFARKGEFKKEELSWSGLLEWLNSLKKTPSDKNLPDISTSDFASPTNLGHRNTIAIPLPGDINIPSYSGFLFDASLIKSLASDTQNLRDFPTRKTFSEKSLGPIDVKVRLFMMNGVASASHDGEILRSIVESIPIDVMNDLLGEKLSSDFILNNPSVFQKAFSINNSSSVSARHNIALSSLISNATGKTAKIIDVLFDTARELRKIDSTIIASNDHNALQESVYSAINYKPDHTKSQSKKLTKQDVLDYLDENNVQLQEVEKSGMSKPSEGVTQFGGGATKFSQYVLPGGENYRELLLTLPVIGKSEIDKAMKMAEEAERKAFELQDNILKKSKEITGKTASIPSEAMANIMAMDNYKEHIPTFRKMLDDWRLAEKTWHEYDTIFRNIKPTIEQNYTSSHWEEPNVLAHVRFDERTGPNGEKILHISEIQSDWHQEGRKKGYKGDEKIYALIDPKGYLYRHLPTREAAEAELDAGGGVWRKAGWTIKEKDAGTVPSAPFKKTWPLLTIKRMVRYAAENGFDRISWDTGEVQADRYDLSKQISEIKWAKYSTSDAGEQVGIKARDLNGKQVLNEMIDPEKVQDYIGKELAEKIVNSDKRQGDFSGLDLKVGGEGMKSFYDRLLPNEVNKFFNKKAWGKAKVGKGILISDINPEDFEGPMPTDEQINEGKLTSWQLPITPEMKSKALSEGMPLFQIGKKPLPDFMQEFISNAEKEKPSKFGNKKDSPPPQTPEGADSWLKDQADSLVKTAVHFMPKNQPHLNFMEKLIASPEWYQHPVMQKIVKIFTRNRSELYHQYFNYINDTGEEADVVKTLKDLKHKGLSLSQKLRGKSSKDYKFLEKMVDEVDTKWQKNKDDTLEEHYAKVEKHYRSKGASDDVINAWLTSRKAYDKALDLMQGQMEDMIQKVAPKGPRSDLKEVKFGDESTVGYGKQYLESPDKFSDFFTVTHKTADKWGLPSQEGINYVVGKFKDGPDHGVQTINFKKELFDEKSANDWWGKNRDNISLTLKESDVERVKELRSTLKGALSLMGDLQGSYAPRQRSQGSWAVQAHKRTLSGKVKTYREHRSSYFGADRLAKKLRKEGWTVKEPKEFARLPESIYQDIKTVAVAKALEQASKKMAQAEGLKGELTLSFNEELLGHVSDLIKARGFRSTMIHRHGEGVVEGYNKDPLERFLIYTNSLSGGMSKAKVAEMGTKAILGEYVDGERVGGIDPSDEPRAYEVATEYLKEQLRNTEPMDRYIGLAKSVATFKYLGFNLRSLGVNLTAVVTTTPAAIQEYALGGKGSFAKIGKELVKAGKDYARFQAGLEVKDRGYGVNEFLKEIKQRGYDDPQYTREALGNLRQTHQKVWPAMMDASMYLFGKSEEWNRGTTMLAAYRLAREQGVEKEAAIDLAKEASDKAHGVYGKSTLPAWAQGKNPFAKGAQLFYMYSKFGHNYVQMCYDLGMRKHNIKAFAWAALSPLVLAGGAAFPFKDEIFWFFGAVLKAIGIDRDPEKWVWDQTRRYLGDKGELIARHGVTGAAGVDISGSLSIGIGVPKGLLDLTGAAGGVYKDIEQGIKFGMQRQYGRAAEKLLPKGIENPLRALRESKTGLVTQRGKRLFTDKGKPYMPSKLETVERVAGFRSAKEATLSERVWEAKREESTYNERRTDIYESYRAYLANPSKDRHKEIMKMVKEYNKSIKGLNVPRITFESMKRQAKSMKRPTKRQAKRLQ